MTPKLATRQIRLHEWAAILKGCKASGQKVDIYCEQHGLVPQMYDAENALLAGELLLWHKVFAPMPGGNVFRRKQSAVLLLDRMQERTIPILFYI